MKTPSSSAQDRKVSEWFSKLERGEIKLPRFQRPQAWDRKRVGSLLDTIFDNLPLGVTLLLNIDEEPFVSRYLATAPETNSRVTEHLLDGQQRLTALWRALHNNYEEVSYFYYLSEYDDEVEVGDVGESYSWFQTRWQNKNGKLMPLWVDSPEGCLSRGLIPMQLFRPGDIGSEVDEWVTAALASKKPESGSEDFEQSLTVWMEAKKQLGDRIREHREVISHFNLPYLALPTQTTKETALQVFINMNTNSKPLSQYDIIRAEIEGVAGVSLDDYQAALNKDQPRLSAYSELPFLILATSALMQKKMPNQRGMWDMSKEKMVQNWDDMVEGLKAMAVFLEQEGLYDRQRLPTTAVLAVIAALYVKIPAALDARGNAEKLLRKYLWSSFFTDRYENSAATHAYNDFVGLKKCLKSKIAEDQVPVLDRKRYPLATAEALTQLSWPKRENIRARAVMAVFSKLGARDFADGSLLTAQQLAEGRRHYHHVFPAALLKASGIEKDLALNCTLITDKTNLDISNKDPLKYLQERYDWADQDEVNARLATHLIPIDELKCGSYESLAGEALRNKLQTDFQAFLNQRAEYVVAAMNRLVAGQSITASEIINAVDNQ